MHLRGPFREILGLNMECGPIFEVPEMSLDRQRGQYLTYPIIESLSRIFKGGEKLVLGVVDVDLFFPRFNFVFGQANKMIGVAIVSTFRPRGEDNDGELFRNRALKGGLHETGHLLGLGPCHDKWCVMYFSNTLMDIDEKMPRLCTRWKNRLRDMGVNVR